MLRLGRVIIVVAGGAVGCTAEDPGASADTNVVNIKISDMQFTPASATVKIGQKVRWTWAGGTHNVVSGPDCEQPDGVFRSAAPQAGGSYDWLPEKAGTFKYYCEVHCTMGMKAEVIVQP
jgi:plastocyanin